MTRIAAVYIAWLAYATETRDYQSSRKNALRTVFLVNSDAVGAEIVPSVPMIPALTTVSLSYRE